MISPILQRPLRLARAYPREATIAVGALLFSAAAMASVVHLAPTSGPLAHPFPSPVARPAPPENGIQNVAPDKAVALNQEIPLSAPAGPAAPAFAIGASANTRDTATTCLAQAVYYEAGQESDEGQRGVAQVVLNRVRHPAFPASVCGVVYQGSTRPTGCQFTFTCDGSLLRRPDAGGWARARKVAVAALGGEVAGSVGYATHYHANYVLPTWAHTLAKTDVIGAHLFYRWSGGWGQPSFYGQRYSGHEASAEALRSAALSAHAAYVAAGVPTAGHPAPPADAARADGLAVAQQPNGRVTLHFTPQARAAVEAAMVPLSKADDKHLRSVLDAGAPASDQKPLG